METRFEISSGGVIFRVRGGRVEICLIQTHGGAHWQLPKGHVDKGESLEDTAAREVTEETGLRGRSLGRIDKVEYWFQSTENDEQIRHHKVVYFHLMEYAGGSVDEHDFEVDEARWFPIEEAIETLTFENERKVARRAAVMIAEQIRREDP